MSRIHLIAVAAALATVVAAPAQAVVVLNHLTSNALARNSLTHNSITHNALASNSVTHNALANNALATAVSDLNGVVVKSIALPAEPVR